MHKYICMCMQSFLPISLCLCLCVRACVCLCDWLLGLVNLTFRHHDDTDLLSTNVFLLMQFPESGEINCSVRTGGGLVHHGQFTDCCTAYPLLIWFDLLGSPLANSKGGQVVLLGWRHITNKILQTKYFTIYIHLETWTCSVCVHISVTHTCQYKHTTSKSHGGEVLCCEVLLYLFFETRFALHLSYIRWNGVPYTHGSV